MTEQKGTEMKPVTLMNLPAATAKRLEDVSDERRYGNPIMVYTAKGLAFDPDPDYRIACHVRGFANKAELVKGVRAAEPCHCQRCTGD
jgi:hypothetical protein